MARTQSSARTRGTEAPFFTVSLRESVFSAPDTLVVDEANGIIKGVKIAGMESENIPQGVRGATKGTRYTDRAFAAGIKLYEGAMSDKNHNVKPANNPWDSNPDQRIGWFTNVVHKPGQGVFGDYHLLKSDPFAAKLLEAAKKNPRCFCLSHDAYGKGTVVDGWFVIDELTHVGTIDCVKEGGTTASLIESRRQGSQPMKSTFQKLLESSTNPKLAGFTKKSHIARLLEMDGLGDTVLDAPVAAEEPAMGWRQHFGNMLKAIVEDESLTPDDLKAKMNAAMKFLDNADKPEADAEKALNESDAEPDDKKKDDKDEKASKESAARDAKLKKLESQTAVRKLCESKGFLTVTQNEVEIIAAVDPAQQEFMIETFKNNKRTPTPVKSQAAGTHVPESRVGGQGEKRQPTRPLLR